VRRAGKKKPANRSLRTSSALSPRASVTGGYSLTVSQAGFDGRIFLRAHRTRCMADRAHDYNRRLRAGYLAIALLGFVLLSFFPTSVLVAYNTIVLLYLMSNPRRA